MKSNNNSMENLSNIYKPLDIQAVDKLLKRHESFIER